MNRLWRVRTVMGLLLRNGALLGDGSRGVDGGRREEIPFQKFDWRPRDDLRYSDRGSIKGSSVRGSWIKKGVRVAFMRRPHCEPPLVLAQRKPTSLLRSVGAKTLKRKEARRKSG